MGHVTLVGATELTMNLGLELCKRSASMNWMSIVAHCVVVVCQPSGSDNDVVRIAPAAAKLGGAAG